MASFPSTSATISPSRMTRMRVQMPTSSSSSDETTRTPRPDLREVVDDSVDLGLRRDVDASGGLIEEQHATLVEQPARKHDLLLVAAREQTNDAIGIVRHRVQRPELLVRAGALLPHVQQPTREAVEVRDGHVLRLAPVEDERLRLAVLWSEAEPSPNRSARAVGAQPLALHEELAGLRLVEPVDQAEELRPARSDQPAQTDDLAGVNFQAHAANSGQPSGVPNLEQHTVGAHDAVPDRAARPSVRP